MCTVIVYYFDICKIKDYRYFPSATANYITVTIIYNKK